MIIDERALKYDGSKGIPHSRHNGQPPKTGDWRTFKPCINKQKCVKCMTCFVNCPEAAIAVGKDGYPYINYYICKGCLVCVKGCPVKAITAIEDVHAEHLRRRP